MKKENIERIGKEKLERKATEFSAGPLLFNQNKIQPKNNQNKTKKTKKRKKIKKRKTKNGEKRKTAKNERKTRRKTRRKKLVDSIFTRTYTLIALFSTALLTVISLPPFAIIFSINVISGFTVGFFLSAYAIIALIYAALLYSHSHNALPDESLEGYESKTIKLLLLCFYFVLAYAAIRHVVIAAILALVLFAFVGLILSRLSPLLRAGKKKR